MHDHNQHQHQHQRPRAPYRVIVRTVDGPREVCGRHDYAPSREGFERCQAPGCSAERWIGGQL